MSNHPTRKRSRRMTVTVVLPLHCTVLPSNDSLTIRAQPSRALWNVLAPLLLDHPYPQTALCLLLEACFDWSRLGALYSRLSTDSNADCMSNNESLDGNNPIMPCHDATIPRRRTRKIPLLSTKLPTPARKLTLFLLPPSTERVHYGWIGRLLRYENIYIQVCSISGYLATLGGGFFLCHHFDTAIYLARQQQRLSIFLNDQEMYYKYSIHMAYSHIYAGHFRTAQRLLRLVQTQVPDHTVLQSMCRSARLFARRMKRAQLEEENSHAVNATIDDYQRIRVVGDKSRADDLVIPFSRAGRRVR